jgi:hypothetical protein
MIAMTIIVRTYLITPLVAFCSVSLIKMQQAAGQIVPPKMGIRFAKTAFARARHQPALLRRHQYQGDGNAAPGP